MLLASCSLPVLLTFLELPKLFSFHIFRLAAESKQQSERRKFLEFIMHI